jgi:hypothetical protein
MIRRIAATLLALAAPVALAAASPAAALAAEAPTVALTSPRTGWGYDNPATIDLRATASSSVGIARVEFRDAGVLVGTDSTEPYSVRLVVTTDGTHRYTATAVDTTGASATSAEAAVTVTTPPTITVRGLVQAGVEHNCLVLTADGVTYNLINGDPKIVFPGALVEVTGRLLRYAGSYCQQGRILQVTEAKPL